MKHYKAKQLHPYATLKKNIDKAGISSKSKLNHPSDPLARRCEQGSNKVISGGQQLNKKRLASMECDFNILLQPKSPASQTLLQSPCRNGLSPRDTLDQDKDKDENEVRKLQLELKQQLLIGKGNAAGKPHSQVGALKQQNRPTYSCSACGAKFHIKSLLGAHRRTHEDEFNHHLRERPIREKLVVGNSNANTANKDNKQCKFCDRIFDLERALRIHQMCHCNKITPQQRRKLSYTDLDHEGKNTPLPKFQRLPKGHVMPLYQPVPDPNMPRVALGPSALKMIEQEQLQLQQQLMRAKRRSNHYTVRVAGPMGRWH